jgi:thiamine-phosphate diphosphorylase
VFIVNDSLELASSVDADGLHIGEGDLEVALARRMWTAPKVLGVSARTPARARAAASEGADYLGTGPVFGTTSKANAPEAIGLTGLRGVIAQVSIPVIAIGGVDAANAALAIEAGASGVAVISSVVAADDVERATHELRRAIDEAFRGARRGWV